MRFLFLAAALGLAMSSRAQPAPPTQSVAAQRVEPGAIVVDGQLDDAAWASIEVAGGFIQRQPTPGAAMTESTEARIAYDGTAVFVAIRMNDSQRVTSALGRRDERLASDYASVIFDSYGDDRTAFQFEVNPAGVQRDFLFYDDVREDRSWDAVWSSAVSVDDRGWSAEFKIPLSQLRYNAAKDVQAWGVQFLREIHRTGEYGSWAPIRPDEDGFVSRFGSLTGVAGLTAPRRIEVVPYAATSLTRAPGSAADPFYSANDAAPRMGLDFKYGITGDITLAGTVNPDFGQVEADPAQVNLGGFELFFQERRPFFVEGTDAFSTEPRRNVANNRPDLLYTRRIGRSPQRGSFVPQAARDAAGAGGSVYSDAPQQSAILGALKLSGRAGRVSFGVLNATTRPEYGRFRAFDAGGTSVADDRAIVEPLTNYFVGRARATFDQTIVGGLLTSVIRDTGEPAINALMPGTATVVGFDIERPVASAWRMSAQVAQSVSTGSQSSILDLQTAFPRILQRPDADYLHVDSTATSLSGWTAEANLMKTEGRHWLGALHASATSPGFDSNALGFQSRADFANLMGLVYYQENEAKGVLRSWSANAVSALSWNHGGDRIGTFISSNVNVQFKNFWGVNMSSDFVPRFMDDRLTRGGPIATRDAGGSLFVNLNTDSRKPISGYAGTGYYGNELGRYGINSYVQIEARPSSSVTFSLGPEFNVGADPRQFVTSFDAPEASATFGRRYVFGHLDQQSIALDARLNWTFTPDLSLQLYARPFVATGRYSSYSEFDRPGAFRLPVYGQDLGTAVANPDGSTLITPGDGGAPFTVSRDFTVRALQGNAVLRWQYRPGSVLFFVWQQQRDGFEGDGSLRFNRDVGGLFSDPPSNVFLIKLSYWLG